MAYFRYANKLKKDDEPNYLRKWDFTKSLTDEIAGKTIDIQNVYEWTPENGIYIKESNNYFEFTTGIGFNEKNWVIEIDVGESNMTSNRDGRFVMRTNEKSYNTPTGFVYRYVNGTHYWSMCNGYGWQDNYMEQDGQIFNNKTLRLVNNSGVIEIFANNTKVDEFPDGDYREIYIGNKGNAFCPVYIKAIRTYYIENE